MRTDKWYEEHKSEILSLYNENMKIQDIASKLQCNRSKLYRKFNEWNIQRRKRLKSPVRCNAKYKINSDYFNIIDTEHKAYWIGFLFADGFVNHKEILFCLQKQDEYIIQKFLNDLQSNHLIKYDTHNNPFVTICNQKMCQDLINKGFHNRKSWNFDFDILLNSIPKELENHFIRGMFDGDGSIQIYMYDYLKTPQYHLGYTGLEKVCNYIKEKLSITRNLVYEGNVTYTVITRDPALINRINNYLYKNATIYMNRKFETFKKIKMETFNDYNRSILF